MTLLRRCFHVHGPKRKRCGKKGVELEDQIHEKHSYSALEPARAASTPDGETWGRTGGLRIYYRNIYDLCRIVSLIVGEGGSLAEASDPGGSRNGSTGMRS
jgi:hypothetical protein